MSIQIITLQEYLDKKRIYLDNEILRNSQNIQKIQNRIDESDGDEKNRLENIMVYHVNYKNKLESIDFVPYYTKMYDDYIKRKETTF